MAGFAEGWGLEARPRADDRRTRPACRSSSPNSPRPPATLPRPDAAGSMRPTTSSRRGSVRCRRRGRPRSRCCSSRRRRRLLAGRTTSRSCSSSSRTSAGSPSNRRSAASSCATRSRARARDTPRSSAGWRRSRGRSFMERERGLGAELGPLVVARLLEALPRGWLTAEDFTKGTGPAPPWRMDRFYRCGRAGSSWTRTREYEGAESASTGRTAWWPGDRLRPRCRFRHGARGGGREPRGALRPSPRGLDPPPSRHATRTRGRSEVGKEHCLTLRALRGRDRAEANLFHTRVSPLLHPSVCARDAEDVATRTPRRLPRGRRAADPRLARVRPARPSRHRRHARLPDGTTWRPTQRTTREGGVDG